MRTLLSAVLVVSLLFVSGCKSTSSGSDGKTGTGKTSSDSGNGKKSTTGDPDKNDGKSEKGGFVADQPEFPVEDDDPFFTEGSSGGETFRVLIADGNYQVRQVRFKEQIRRKPDVNGDRSQLEVFEKFAYKYGFADFLFRGSLRVRLNPHTGEIEMVKYVEGRTPKATQAAILYKNDVSRFTFIFPRKIVSVREFYVAFEWRIRKRAGLSDEEARSRLLEFLKSQIKNR